MKEFYGWIKGIISFMCILNILLQILPAGNFKKYVRFFGGLLFILIVLAPLAQLVNAEDIFEKNWNLESVRGELDEMKAAGEGLEELKVKAVDDAYRKEVSRQIESIAQAWGFQVDNTQLTFQDEKEGISILTQIVIKLRIQNKTADQSASLKELKNELQEIYQIPINHIRINVQE